LGIKTIRLGSWGRGFEFNRQLDRKAHALARDFGITQLDINSWMAVKSGYGGPPCSLCAEFNLNAELRFYSLPPTRHKRGPLLTSDQHDDETDSPLTTPVSEGGNAP
jgi:hypothetical protein